MYEMLSLNTGSYEPEDPFVLATVGGVYDDGLSLIFDGQSAASFKHYKCNTSVVFKASDRVKLCRVAGTYIVEYVIGSPASEDTDTPSGDGAALPTPSENYRILCSGDNDGDKTPKWTKAVRAGYGESGYAVGFYGGSPYYQMTLSSTAQNTGWTKANASNYLIILNNLINILKTLNLFSA